MPTRFDTLRAEAQYRVVFPGAAFGTPEETGRRVATILGSFPSTEIQLQASKDGGDIIAYVSVPRDATPEGLDAKAEAVRASWGG